MLGRMVEAQEAAGVTHALVSDSFFMESAAAALPVWSAPDRARLYNDTLAALVARHPEPAVRAGLRGSLLGRGGRARAGAHGGRAGLRGRAREPESPIGGRRYLDDPACAPLLAAAARRGAGRSSCIRRASCRRASTIDDFVLSLIVGRPTQTAVCAARLIFTGTLDRHPRLPLLLAHGGGVLPAMAGRLDATWRAYRPDRWRGPDVLTAPPSIYLRRFHVDTNVWSVPALRLLVDGARPRAHAGRQRPAAGVVPAGRIARAPRPARPARGRPRGDPLGERGAAVRHRRAAGAAAPA